MTSMNISLPKTMKDWVDERLSSGRYHNASEYIRDLIRKDQDEGENARAFAAAIELGRTSGRDTRDFDKIISDAREMAKSRK